MMELYGGGKKKEKTEASDEGSSSNHSSPLPSSSPPAKKRVGPVIPKFSFIFPLFCLLKSQQSLVLYSSLFKKNNCNCFFVCLFLVFFLFLFFPSFFRNTRVFHLTSNPRQLHPVRKVFL